MDFCTSILCLPHQTYLVTTWANVGVMENNGVEAIVNVMPVASKNFEWSTSVNFSTNTNKLVSLSNDEYKTTNPFFNTGGTGEPIQTYTHQGKSWQRYW